MVGPTTFGYQNLGFGAGGADFGKLELIETQSSTSYTEMTFSDIKERKKIKKKPKKTKTVCLKKKK